MTDLIAFLLARIAEDEGMAAAAASDGLRRYGDRYRYGDALFYDDGWLTMSVPRLLAECAVKKQLIDLHRREQMDVPGSPHIVDVYCDECGNHLGGYPCPTLRLLATPYSEHADFDPSWELGETSRER